MSKRLLDGTAKDNAFLTVKFEECALIIQCHPTLSNPNPSLKLREKDGTLWEAVCTNEERQVRLDDMDALSEETLKDAMHAYSRYTDLDAFRADHHPRRECAFELKCLARRSAVASSACFRPHIEAQWIGMRDDSADLLVKYKHFDRELELNLTRYESVRLTLQRVPEFDDALKK